MNEQRNDNDNGSDNADDNRKSGPRQYLTWIWAWAWEQGLLGVLDKGDSHTMNE